MSKDDHFNSIVRMINIGCSILSIIGSMFIILSFIFIRKIREIYHIRIVLSIGGANLIFTLAGLGSIIPDILKNDGQNPICKAFGFARQLGSVSSLFLTAVFAVMVLLCATSKLPDIRRYEKLTIIPVVLVS